MFDYFLTQIVKLSFDVIFALILIYNIVAVIVIVFYEKRKPTTALAWLMVLFFLPVLGFLLYLFVGRHIFREKIFKEKTINDALIRTIIEGQINEITGLTQYPPGFEKLQRFHKIIIMLLNEDHAHVSIHNEIEVYTNGNEKFKSFLAAIESAERYIHIEYYIIRNDELGRKVIDALTRKAKEGLEVRLLADAVGVNSLPKNFFNELKKAGGYVEIFFPLWVPFINLRLNHRNHRKFLIIDGKIGFIGGFNIGDEYLGKGPLGYWRDTHFKITGIAVHSLQLRFIMDWNYASKNKLDLNDFYFQDIEKKGNVALQIVSSGPDAPQMSIRDLYLCLIHEARESVYIETPYFVPDEPISEALRTAAQSGIDVRIIIPCKPDHPFVYWSSYSYLGELLPFGVKGYTYEKGFIHSKTIVVDGLVGSVGTANWDIRSFKLNFETNASFGDENLGAKMKNIFLLDLKECKELTLERYEGRNFIIKVKEGIARLLSNLQ